MITVRMTTIQAARDQMISQQVRTWDVLDTRTLTALRQVPRERFVPLPWLPISEPRVERALKYGGRVLAVVGTGPGMAARLVRRLGPSAFSTQSLFETTLEALEHAPVPPAFTF